MKSAAPGFMNKKAAPPKAEEDPPVAAPPSVEGDAPPEAGDGEPPSDMQADQKPNVTPEEQESYDLFVGNCLDAVAKPENSKFRDAVIRSLSAGEPVEALSDTALNLVEHVKQDGQQNGQAFSVDVLLNGGEQVVQHLAEFATALKIHEYTPDEIEASFLRACDQYRVRHPGEMDPEIAKQELGALQEAEKSGNPDSVLPGISEASGKMQKTMGPQAPQAAAPAQEAVQ